MLAQKVLQTFVFVCMESCTKSCTNITSVSSTESYQFTIIRCAQEKMNDNYQAPTQLHDGRRQSLYSMTKSWFVTFLWTLKPILSVAQ